MTTVRLEYDDVLDEKMADALAEMAHDAAQAELLLAHPAWEWFAEQLNARADALEQAVMKESQPADENLLVARAKANSIRWCRDIVEKRAANFAEAQKRVREQYTD